MEEERTVGWWIVSTFLSIKSIGRLEFRSEVTTRSLQRGLAVNEITRFLDRSWRLERNHVMSRGEHFARSSVHLAINFVAHKAFFSLSRIFSPVLLPSHLFFVLRTFSPSPPPHHHHPPFSSIFRSIPLPHSLSLLHDSGHVLTVRRTNTKQAGGPSTLRPRLDWIGGAGG